MYIPQHENMVRLGTNWISRLHFPSRVELRFCTLGTIWTCPKATEAWVASSFMVAFEPVEITFAGQTILATVC